ncbi:MAG: oligopeptide transporter, OPT family [Candidatus Latescibacterota bacterium]
MNERDDGQPETEDSVRPYIPPTEMLPEFTVKAVVLGCLFGMMFGAANAYLGLKAGMTVSTSIPVAVMTVAVFRLLRGRLGPASILEANLSQTVGSASSSLASGVIFTIPVLFLWGLDPTLLQMATLALLGGLLGILFMIPLRRYLIAKEHKNLPYPEGTACAEVLIASEAGGSRARNVFVGLGIGAGYKFLSGFLHLWNERVYLAIPRLKKAVIGVETTPALLGVGYILGYRIAAVMVAGSLVSWVVLIPLIAHFGEGFTTPIFPEMVKTIGQMSPSEIWTRYIRYIGAGAVIFGGIVTVVRSVPTMVESFRLGTEEVRARLSKQFVQRIRTERDLPLFYVLGGAALIVLVIALVPHIIGNVESFGVRLVCALCIAVFSFFFVTVSSRIVGLVGVSSNPTSGMTIVTLLGTSLVFVFLGWTDEMGKVAALTVGTIVCVSASIAGDTSQDLKTGFLVGATPYKQQVGEMIGAIASVLAVCGAVLVLNSVYTFGSPDLPAPQATLMKTVIEGVLSGDIPWGLVLTGVAFGAVAELCAIPSLPFAVGLYLPLSTMTPIFVGGCIRQGIERRYRRDAEQLRDRKEQGILFGSGLIAGEGLMGVGVALYAFFRGKPEGIGSDWLGSFGDLFSLALFAMLGYALVRAAGRVAPSGKASG